MKKSIVSLLLVLTAITIAYCQTEKRSPGAEKTFTNPVWDGADPWLQKHGDDYVCCYSAENSIFVSRSKKMTLRGEAKSIWKAPSSGWNRACVWAPEIHYIGNRWYVYYTAGESGPPFIHQRSGVLRSKTEDVFSEYEDMGMLFTGDNPVNPDSGVWAIDLTVLEYRDKLFAVWSGWIKNEKTDATPQHLFIAEMENPYTIKGKRVKISSPVENWETGGPLNLNEGPVVLKKDNNVFIVYSCRESWLADYKLGMLQLINPEGNLADPGNWSKKGPVFSGNSEVYGVGHCSFVKSPDKSEEWIIYHSKKSSAPGWQRDVRMQPFTWNPDGTPNFGKPVPAGKKLNIPSGEGE
ncbi:MAG TPA: glycoside hydrolase family 43 protein [Prolixibacteraceae bacterium]|nr:glycoside hydrolase family 43 protein [Prolixibacteraceae bacterium]